MYSLQLKGETEQRGKLVYAKDVQMFPLQATCVVSIDIYATDVFLPSYLSF